MAQIQVEWVMPIVFSQITHLTQYVGYFPISPQKNVSIGLWTSSVIGSSISSSSSSDNNQISNHSGIFYDYESVYYTSVENTLDEVYVGKNISVSKLVSVTDFIKGKNDVYNLLSYNCATFACDLWNHVADTNYWTGWFRAPRQLRDDIKRDYPDSYRKGSGSLTTKKIFAIYSTSAKELLYGKLS